ncbi:MAG TPA: hypothetical protein PLP57_09110 [Candidatus Saccharicenans sp.]|jgi:hypothetical protein|nr:hypothetical protein [Candidatus Saccharicenans sp.]HRD02782.1 hypothetical protein [Candidatus Saccharicenans sp.]
MAKLEIEEVLIEPLEDVLLQVARGIAKSQLELDKNSLATQILIDNNEDLSKAGITATWYHFSEVNAELKMNLSLQEIMEKEEEKVRSVKMEILSAPINASYKNAFDYDVSGASMIKAKIVSVPPPVEVKGR